MPRIAVAVGVLVLIVFSIGFNIARYSTVWEMVGDSAQTPQPDQASHSATVLQPAGISKSETTSPSVASWDWAAAERSPSGRAGGYSYGASSGGETWEDRDDSVADTEEDGTAHEAPYDYATPEVEEVEPPGRYAAGVDPAEASVPSASVIRVVGVSGTGVRASSAGHRDSGGEFRRLPPIDRVAPFTADHRALLPEDPAAVYPSTGS